MDRKRCIAFGMISVFLLASAPTVLAAGAGKDEDGVPSTAVARLKIGKGTAWVRSGGSTEWEESASNFPLVETSRVSIPQGSEAEIAALEAERDDLHRAMADPSFYRRDGARVSQGRARLEAVQTGIEEGYHRWESLEAALRRLEAIEAK